MQQLSPLYITVPKTARYYLVGSPTRDARDIWVACHGFGQLASDFAKPFVRVESATRMIAVPEALSRYYLDTRPGHTAASKVGATWLTREDRVSEIADIVMYLDLLSDALLAQLAPHWLTRADVRVHALGFSQGGPAVSRWAALGSTVVDHLVTWAHAIPDDVDLRALHERRSGLTIDVVYGTRDKWIKPEAVERQRAALDASGIPYRIHHFDGGHVLNSAVLRDLMNGATD